MKIAFVDDDRDCLDTIGRFCTDFGKHCGYLIETFSFTCAKTFLEAFKNSSFSIVFMDIYLEGTDGITAALEMRRMDSRCLLIFLTSSLDFMPDAFSCHAFEYITKPFSPQRIFNVLSDAVKLLPQAQEYIELVNGRSTVQIPPDSIISAITDAHYLDITLTDGQKLRCRMTMAEFMEKTGSDSRFLSVNKGITVNAEHILTFENHCCIMENNTKFPVRIRDGARIKQAAQDYHFKKIRSRQHGRKGDWS